MFVILVEEDFNRHLQMSNQLSLAGAHVYSLKSGENLVDAIENEAFPDALRVDVIIADGFARSISYSAKMFNDLSAKGLKIPVVSSNGSELHREYMVEFGSIDGAPGIFSGDVDLVKKTAVLTALNLVATKV